MSDSNALSRNMTLLGLAAALTLGTAWAQDKPASPAPAAPAAEPKPQAGQEAAPQAKKPLTAKQKERVFIKDLEGTWISRDYVKRLEASRSPNEAARKGGGIAIKIQREGPSTPILITNFQRAVLQAVIDVQPGDKPKSYRLAVAKEDHGAISADELSFIRFRGERDSSGTFKTLSISEPNFAKGRFLTYERLASPLEQFVNATVIAGKYTDAQGRTYEFSEGGDAVLPEAEFAYEVSLDPKAASNCDLVESHREREQQAKERLGFSWKGEQLHLFKVTGNKAPYKCEGQPFAVLSRQ